MFWDTCLSLPMVWSLVTAKSWNQFARRGFLLFSLQAAVIRVPLSSVRKHTSTPIVRLGSYTSREKNRFASHHLHHDRAARRRSQMSMRVGQFHERLDALALTQ